MSSDRDSTTTFYAQALARAAMMTTNDLRPHARISDLEGFPHCRQCFCCACWDVLFEREKQELTVWRIQRQELFEEQQAKVQIEKAADRKRMGFG